MKRILFLILSFVTTFLSANNQEVIHNYITANNNVYNVVSKLDESKKTQFYDELYNSKTSQEIASIATNYLGESDGNLFLSNLGILGKTIDAFYVSNISVDDMKTYINANSKKEEPDAGACLNMEQYKRCIERSFDISMQNFLDTWYKNVGEFGSAAAGLGATIGLFGGPIGVGAGAEGGLVLGTVSGLGYSVFTGMNSYGKMKKNCYELHCLGIDNGLETAGGGGPGGGYKGGFVFIELK